MSNVDIHGNATTAFERMGIGTVPVSSVPDLLDLTFESTQKFTVCLVGETGIGKTPIVHQWCAARGGYMHVLNLAQVTAENLSLAMFNEDGTQYQYAQPEWFVHLNEEAEKRGCAVLFMDECNRGDKATINTFFTLTDDRRIHHWKLHENVLVVAAMNPSDGAYMVNSFERDHAMRKRLNFVYVTADLAGWLRYARGAGFHQDVTDFIAARPTAFYDAPARDAGKAFCCPSNWEKVSHTCQAATRLKMPLTGTATRVLLEGQIGVAAATAFLDFVADRNTVVQPKDVLEHYFTSGRPRVAALLGNELLPGPVATVAMQTKTGLRARIDVISELNKGLALHLLSEQPDVVEIAPQLGRYLLDLPRDMFQAFWSDHMQGASKASKTGTSYISELGKALRAANPGYAEAVAGLLNAQAAFATRSVSGMS